MRNYIKSKLFVLVLFSLAAIFFAPSPLIASDTITITETEHKNIITQYIKDIRILQNQIFSLSESIIGTSPEDSTNIKSKINFIYSQIESLDRNISNHLNAMPKLSSQRRDTLITFDALHFLENSLYQLNQLIKGNNSVQKARLLEDFYFYRTSTADTLNRLEDIISRE